MVTRFAIIEGGTVANIAKAAEPLADHWIEATEGAEIGGTWDSETGFQPATIPEPKPADLTRAQFEYLLALTGFGTVWDALAENAEAAGDRETFARLKAERSRSRFLLDKTLAVVAQFREAAAQIAPEVDLSDDAIQQAWDKAAGYRGIE